MTIYVDKHGFREGVSSHDALRAVAQFQARVALDAVAPLTNNIGGTASPTWALTAVAADAVNAANAGTNLAQEAGTETAFGTVRDALSELVAKANAAAAKVGVASITDSSGGTTADGTAGAVTVTVTAAATGVQATQTNTFLTAVSNATYSVAQLVNKVAAAAGTQQLSVGWVATPLATIPAMSTDAGAAADPGVTKAVIDAKLAAIQVNLKTIGEALNLALAGPGNAPVVAV